MPAILPNVLSNVLSILYFTNIIIGFLIIFFEKRNPGTTWAWLMVIAIVPYVGFAFYLLFGMGSRKFTGFAAKARHDESLIKQNPNPARYDRLSGTAADLSALCEASGGGAVTSDNSVVIYNNGVEKFDALFEDIRNSRAFIHMQYYIVRGDNLGRKLIAALCERARAGVEVRLLVDSMGNSAPKRFYAPLLSAGGRVSFFTPPSLIRLNFRNHRKLCVIDGKMGYIGGLNIGDEYLGVKPRFGPWRDTHARISGGAVWDMELRFICDWNFCAKEKITDMNRFLIKAPSFGSVPAQIISNGPDTSWASVHYAYNKLISGAKKSVYIQTPYFVPDDGILEALRIAALSGVDVRVMIPGRPDHPFVYWASLSYLGELLRAGVKCYKYGNGFIHSKVIVTDGSAASVGSANVDARSFKLNFETNAVIYDTNTAELLGVQFMRDLEHCEEITPEWYSSRSKVVMFKEAFSRLLSPLL